MGSVGEFTVLIWGIYWDSVWGVGGFTLKLGHRIEDLFGVEAL
jgi:hypothetical protein